MRCTYITILLAFSFFTHALKAQIITTVAGNGTGGSGGNGGQATAAQFLGPNCVAFDAIGNLYVADSGNAVIRMINTAGIISRVAGSSFGGGFSGDGGPATIAGLFRPTGLAFDAMGNMYIADQGNQRIRKVNTSGIISTIAGNGTQSFSGDGGQATAATLNNPQNLCIDASGNLYIADKDNNRIRRVSPSGIITTVAGNGIHGYSGDGIAATASQLSGPYNMSFDAVGNMYIADCYNYRIRKVNTAGIISTVAGNGLGNYSGDGGAATSAELYWPAGVIFDGGGNMYISDFGTDRIRMVNTAGIISTIAGNGTWAYAGDGGLATAAELNGPYSITFDASGNLYIADILNNRIRMVTNVAIAGIEQITDNNTQMTVYPNPANNMVQVAYTGNSIIQEIILYDVLGKEVINTKEKEIDVNALNEGVYFIQVKTAEGILTKKVVVQH
jgi:sugar lactone lactonase YvrE